MQTTMNTNTHASRVALFCRRSLRHAVSLVVLLTAVATLASCSSPVRINIKSNRLSKVHSSGFLPAACDQNGSGMVLRAVFMNSQERAIRDGELLNGRVVAVGKDALSFNSSSLVAFSGGAESSLDIGATGAATFASSVDKQQSLAILVENSASILGRLPDVTVETKFQKDGAINDSGPVSDEADYRRAQTGVAGARTAFVRALASQFKKVRDAAKQEDNVSTTLGLYSFKGNAVTYVGGGASSYLSSDGEIENALGALEREIGGQSSSGAGVYESISKVINGGQNLVALKDQGVERTLIVVVDGYDDYNTNIDSVIETAKNNNVRLFIVHFDPPVANLQSTDFPDLPRYHQSKMVCSSDADCKSFETCKSPTLVDPDYKVTGGKKCVPKRNTKGQVGPIDGYQALACATGGGYIYIDKPKDDLISFLPSWLPWTLDGLWEIPVNVSSSSQVTGSQLLNTSVTVKLNETTRRLNMTQDAGANSPSSGLPSPYIPIK